MKNIPRGGLPKKLTQSFLIFAFVILFFSAPALANSGPVYWQGYPSSEIMLIEKGSPISIIEEDLIFDFSDCADSDFTISGKVEAGYKMLNPTDKQQTVQMAFPFIESLSRLSQDDIAITVDNSVRPYNLYIGNVVNSLGNPRQDEKEANFDFAGIVKTITDEPYQAGNFSAHEQGKLYLITVSPAAGQRINFAVDFRFYHEKTKIMTKGFNRYERDEDRIRIAAGCYEPKNLEILVLGEDVELTINGYTDGELKQKTDLFTSQITNQIVGLKPYLLEYIKENSRVNNDSFISEIQLYNLYAASLDKYFAQNMGFCSEYDLLEQEHNKRVLTLVYTVDFAPHSNKKVSVRYKTTGTMDRKKTATPLYSFDYLLNPAKNWSEFGDLNLKIITPSEAPYIIKSSIELAKKENNVYTATLAGLPENDLSFTLYANEKITVLDRAAGSLRNVFGYSVYLLLGLILLLIIGSGFAIILKIK